MNAIGKVIQINDDVATVVWQRSSSCESCHNCKNSNTCHVHLVFGNQSESVQIKARNKVGAKVGDSVMLETSTTKTLLISVFVFIMPIIISLISYFVTDKYVAASISPGISLVVSFVVSFVLLVKLMNVYVKRDLSVNIVKIVEESEL